MSAKRYYWIKLKEDFFNLDAIDWLMSQDNGCEYVVLYQKLCLLAANRDGFLTSKIGDMTVNFDDARISRATGFPKITVQKGMELFEKLGLVSMKYDNELFLPYVHEIVGGEADSASRVRKSRKKKALQCNTDVTNNLLQSNTDIEIDKDTDIDKEIEIEIEQEKDSQACCRKSSPPPTKYGEFGHVLLTDKQYLSLTQEHGEEKTNDYIRRVDEYCQQHGKGYRDYYLTLKKWIAKDDADSRLKGDTSHSLTKDKPSFDLDEWQRWADSLDPNELGFSDDDTLY